MKIKHFSFMKNEYRIKNLRRGSKCSIKSGDPAIVLKNTYFIFIFKYFTDMCM